MLEGVYLNNNELFFFFFFVFSSSNITATLVTRGLQWQDASLISTVQLQKDKGKLENGTTTIIYRAHVLGMASSSVCVKTLIWSDVLRSHQNPNLNEL